LKKKTQDPPRKKKKSKESGYDGNLFHLVKDIIMMDPTPTFTAKSSISPRTILFVLIQKYEMIGLFSREAISRSESPCSEKRVAFKWVLSKSRNTAIANIKTRYL